MNKTKSIISIVVVILIIVSLLFLCFFDVQIGDLRIPSITDSKDGIRRGLDLVGGSTITFEAEIPENVKAEDVKNNMSSIRSMLQQRVDNMGYEGSNIYLTGDKRITVEIPSIQNPEEAVQKLGATAKLLFKDSDGKVILEGSDVKLAKANYGSVEQGQPAVHMVELEFTDEGAKKFETATAAAAAKATSSGASTQVATGEEQSKPLNYISIILDNETISEPLVHEKISGGKCVISGNYTAETAKYDAALISSGNLPYNLNNVELNSLGPTLGENALKTSVLAALIGIILVCIFMILFYKIPGLISCISLAFYTGLVALIIMLTKTNLTLPGIAGIILSIGMAVDANVVIYERIKEELNLGKTVKTAIKSGFDRAFVAILDSNVTTFIAAVVLGFLGSGPVKGFAMTLGIGVVVSMITAIFITKLLLNSFVGLGIRNIRAYGASKGVVTNG